MQAGTKKTLVVGSGDCPVGSLVRHDLEIKPELLGWRYHKPQSPSFVMAPDAWLSINVNKCTRPDLTSSKTRTLRFSSSNRQAARRVRVPFKPSSTYALCQRRWPLALVGLVSLLRKSLNRTANFLSAVPNGSDLFGVRYVSQRVRSQYDKVGQFAGRNSASIGQPDQRCGAARGAF